MSYKNYYDILGINKNSNLKDIKKAYKVLKKKYKNDKNLNIKLKEAYKILSNGKKKKQYDEIIGNKDSKKVRNKKKILLIILILLFIYCIGGIIFHYIKPNVVTCKSKKVDNGIQIKGFDYILYDDDLEIYKDEFKNLKSNLESDNIDYKEYALSVSKMFIIDLYSLDNKQNMYDIGGLEFVYPDARDNYSLNVTNTLYKYMEDNSDGDRTQELPCVSNVEVRDIVDNSYIIGENTYEGYKVYIDISYVKDLEYDKSAEVILIKDDKYIYVVEKN